MKKAEKFARRAFRLEVKQPPEPEPLVCAPKPMVGLFSMLSDDQKRAALAFKGNHNFGASEHRLALKG